MATLAERHRAAQDAIAKRLTETVQRSWARRIGQSVPSASLSEEWIAEMLAFIQLYRDRSTGTAALYYERERYEQAPGAPTFAGSAPDELLDEQVFTSLDVTGRVRMLEALQGKKHTLAEASEIAGRSAAGAAARLALDGGRSYTLNAVREDRAALGYYRVTRGAGTCSFCAMLASRGMVYKADSFDASDARFFGPGDAKVHDHCNCTMGGVWVAGTPLPEFNTQMASLWSSTGARYSGEAARNAFRNAYEAAFGRRDD